MSTSSPNRIRLQTRISFRMPDRPFPKYSLPAAINLLVYGVVINKHYKDDSSYLQWLSHSKPYNKTRIDLKSIKNITDDPRFDSKLAKKFGKATKDSSKILFIVHGNLNENKLMILKFKDESLKSLFWQGIQYFSKVAMENEATLSDFRKTMAKRLFIDGDKDGSKSLELSEVKAILKKLNIAISSEQLKNIFEKYDKDHNNHIDWSEFQIIIDDLTLKSELKPLFLKYCKEKELSNYAIMRYEQFQTFLKIEQKQEVNDLEFRNLKRLFRKDGSESLFKEESKHNRSFLEQNESDSGLSFSEFCTIIFSKNNEVFDPDKQEIYQSMNRPLTDYYICSSHNTYLMSNQLTGQSSTKAYIEAFERGCRCVELDCWEGDKEPIIYHGYTFTSKILFRDVIQTIKDYAFVSNPYPVILSFENHCIKQQDLMAEILEEILGEMLYVLPENYFDLSKLPSPDQLKYKVLVKDKGVLPIVFNEQFFSGFKVDWKALDNNNLLECDDNEDYLPTKNDNLQSFQVSQQIHKKFIQKDSQEQPFHFIKETSRISDKIKSNNDLGKTVSLNPEINSSLNNIETASQQYFPSKFKTMLYMPKKENLDDEPQSKTFMRNFTTINKKPSAQTLENPSLRQIERTETSKPSITLQTSPIKIKSQQKISKKNAASAKLKKLLGFYGIKMSLLLPRMPWNVSSINEKKFDKLCKDEENQLQEFLRAYFLRTYPSGTRVDSSNYDPVKGFNFGVQMIAMNIQTSDLSLLLYTARFKQNGGKFCGYILKPEHLLAETYKHLKDFTRIRKIVSITIISGQQLKNEDSDEDFVSPFVEISLRGTPQDEKENPTVFRSKTAPHNAFNPTFDLQSQFKLYSPDSVFFIFKIFAQKVTSDEKISWAALPFNCIRQGFRILPLLNHKLNTIEFSCLLLRVQIHDLAPVENV